MPRFLEDYPRRVQTDWSDSLQGVTHSEDHWFFTQKTTILKFHVSADLGHDAASAVTRTQMPDALRAIGGNHFGDLDFRTIDGQGYLFVPVEDERKHGSSDCKRNPRLAVFRDDADLSYVGSTPLPRQLGEFARAGWCAFAPHSLILHSSSNTINSTHPVFRYALDPAAFSEGSIVLTCDGDLSLQQGASAVNIPKYVQGGCFLPNGTLLICSGKQNDEHEGGIRAFDQKGEFLFRSSTVDGPFHYEYHSRGLGGQEPEGLTYWDLDALPRGTAHTRVSGQVHAILLDKRAGTDKVYFKHFEVRPSEID